MKYPEFFSAMTGFSPYPYQIELAESASFPMMVHVPTGLGKTAAVVGAWLWRRFFHPDSRVRQMTPRRLVYCLPMRVLVEQIESNICNWLQNITYNMSELRDFNVPVYVLMGGRIDSGWLERLEDDVILVGTQDQLISRALNRGYALSRYRWPVAFSLLNNDVFWVMDEVQLMGAGLATTLQLQAFRDQMNTYGTTRSIWMSATMTASNMTTVDFRKTYQLNESEIIDLDDAADESQRIALLRHAPKPLFKMNTVLSSDTRKEYVKLLGQEISEKLENYESGDLTLVVMNQVQRAVDLFKFLRRYWKNDDTKPELVLLHSRFRRRDRSVHEKKLTDEMPPEGRLVIATQVVEAGVDIDAATMFTELASWPSLVQRFGRCNRKGRRQAENTAVFWIDIQSEKPDLFLPYSSEEAEKARHVLERMENVSIAELQRSSPDMTFSFNHVIRRKDLEELFDTSPSIEGFDIDVSRYIRDDQSLDLHVYWGTWEGSGKNVPDPPPDTFPKPEKDDLCPVPVHVFSKFLDKIKGKTGMSAWIWDPIENKWIQIRKENLRPGITVLLTQKTGGYSSELGWTGGKEIPDVFIEVSEGREEGMDDEETTFIGRWMSIAEHTELVIREIERIAGSLDRVESVPWNEIITAARWHDLGKAHPAFQGMLADTGEPPDRNVSWAKSSHRTAHPKYIFRNGDETIQRTHFRHELATALAMIQFGLPDLPVYLAASHHGKIRVAIRSIPGETEPADDRRFARGIWEGDTLPSVDLGNGIRSDPVRLDLSVIELGESEMGPCWIRRVLDLLERFGPFRLAYLETVLRIGDWRGSAKGDNGHE